MITEDKVIEIFCMADDFCKFFDAMMAKYTIRLVHKRKYHRSSTMSKAEVMLIMILFHDSGYRCLKNFYLEKVCIHLRNLFPGSGFLQSLRRTPKGGCHPPGFVYQEGAFGKMYGNQFCGQHATSCLP